MTVEQIGYGVGGWQLEDRPNLLRGVLGQHIDSDGLDHDTVSVIETHLDDTPPEWLGSLMDRLLAEGALDVSYAPLQMKKNRPGVHVTLITQPGEADRLARLLLHESSAIGVRIYESRRCKLRREIRDVETELGTVSVKLIYEGDTLLRITPEHASCQEQAAATGRPLPEIYRLVTAAANRRFGLE